MDQSDRAASTQSRPFHSRTCRDPLPSRSIAGLFAQVRDPQLSRTEQIQSDSRIKSVPFELAACRPCVVPVLNRLIRAPRIAGVAQWQSNGFVNRRSSVQSRPPAPFRKPVFRWGFSLQTDPDGKALDGFFLQKSSNRSQTEAWTLVP
jgi:hypothetical protein